MEKTGAGYATWSCVLAQDTSAPTKGVSSSDSLTRCSSSSASRMTVMRCTAHSTQISQDYGGQVEESKGT